MVCPFWLYYSGLGIRDGARLFHREQAQNSGQGDAEIVQAILFLTTASNDVMLMTASFTS